MRLTLIWRGGRGSMQCLERVQRLDAGIDGVIDVTTDCLRHTYVAFLVRQGIRFSELTRIVGYLPAEVLGAYSALSPRGSRFPREAIDVVYPASAPRQPVR